MITSIATIESSCQSVPHAEQVKIIVHDIISNLGALEELLSATGDLSSSLRCRSAFTNLTPILTKYDPRPQQLTTDH